jgi:hypothetical protein
MDRASSSTEVQEILREVREQAKVRRAESGPFAERLSRLDPPQVDLLPASRAADQLREAIRRFGAMPPQPPTLRGRAGAVFVRILRRLLFFQTEQIRALELAAAKVDDEHNRAMEALAAHLHLLWHLSAERELQLSERIAALEIVVRESKR